MAKSNLVNLDALIKREDFGSTVEDEESFHETFSTISIRDLTKGSLIAPNLRKPDFQRETNHWTPGQLVSLLESFVNGDLIPSVILWKSPSYLFVIDGGHRLSAIRAWVEDDYGDGHISFDYFGRDISPDQKKIAEKTRKLINSSIGSYKEFAHQNENPNLLPEERRRISKIISRALHVQWVKGDADKAENSFFNINSQGTPLDNIEEMLLRNRKKPIAISARAIIRAGTGHKYWSNFPTSHSSQVEQLSKELHKTIFEPELKAPIKTLDLPLGGSKSVRTSIQILIDYLTICNKGYYSKDFSISSSDDDHIGDETINVLKRAVKLSKKISGNDSGSLGLHPAVYFYGPTGRHSQAMFMGTVELLADKVRNNDDSFFRKFTAVRERLETLLIDNKDLIATIVQKHISFKRIKVYTKLLDTFIKTLFENKSSDILLSEEDIVKIGGLEGKIVTGELFGSGQLNFSDEIKSQTFIASALKAALKCPICGGYLDPEKSVSYDHIMRKQDGGQGHRDNCQLTHPYCNQAIKN
nr:DUF262 domain-containing protein [uncultured Sphingobacterium sp.]